MAIDLFKLMRDRGYTGSARHFSAQWCDRAPNYLALANGISESAALVVARKLWRSRRWGSKLLCLRLIFEIVWGGEGPL